MLARTGSRSGPNDRSMKGTTVRVPAARPFALVLLTALLACAGCSGSGPGASLAGPSATPALVDSSMATAPSIEPTPDVQASESPVAEPPTSEPPAASISVDGGDPVVGSSFRHLRLLVAINREETVRRHMQEAVT